jgi:GT2 family glycosyltransferase
MMPPSMSVVVLNHNYGRYVGEALASEVSREPGRDRLAEVVVIDDGSADHSHEVYGRFPGVRVVRRAHEGFTAICWPTSATASACRSRWPAIGYMRRA